MPAGAHTSRAKGYNFQTGLTFAFPPNTAVEYQSASVAYDVDWRNLTAGINYASFTARSYHNCGVNTLFMDGAVRFMKSRMDQATWRALGTRNGGEPVGAN